MSRHRRNACLVTLALLAGGCAPLSELAPPVDEQIIGLATRHDLRTDHLERGRAIYVTACARCHTPERVTRYSAEHWEGILPRMSGMAALEAGDAEAVRAYVMATLLRDDGGS